jgi:uncharacterized protein (TIGR00297 family)
MNVFFHESPSMRNLVFYPVRRELSTRRQSYLMRIPISGLTRLILQLSLLGLAFLLPFVDWQQAALGALLALLFTRYLLPDFAPDLRTPSSSPGPALDPGGGAGLKSNIASYPASVLALILVFRHHLDVAAAAWALVAIGHAGGTAAAWAIESPALPWNGSKTAAGFAGFVAAGSAGGLALGLWVNPARPLSKAALISVLAALLGAGLESAPIKLDDNATVPLAAGGFIFCAWLTAHSALASNLPYLGPRLILAVVVNLTFALLALRLKSASRSGAALGFALGALVYLGWGWKSFLILFAFFMLGSISTRLGYDEKLARGVAEARGGARSWREALANVGPGAFFAVLIITTHDERAFLAAFVAAFAEAAGDTVSSEIGQWLAGDAWLIISLRRVRAGENGAVSLAGSTAGLLAAGVITILAWSLRLVSPGGAGIALAAAVAGNIVDSLLGATVERQGLVTNGVVNFAGTAFAGALALAFTLR